MWPATRATWVTFPPWLTQRLWRCFLARDVKVQSEICTSMFEDDHRWRCLCEPMRNEFKSWDHTTDTEVLKTLFCVGVCVVFRVS